MNTKPIFWFFIYDILSIIVVAAVLFLTAGRFNWWAAWATLAVWLVFFAAMDLILIRIHPSLMAERMLPPHGAKSWDKAILSILRLAQLIRYILAGLDQRFGWTGHFPLAAQISSLVACVLCIGLFIWSMASNKFFSQVVRIQSERGHTLVTAGPYRFVRHPGYAAMIVFELALSTLLASWWAILAGGLCASLFVLRTLLEDRALRIELPGYEDYARQVRFRLVRGVW